MKIVRNIAALAAAVVISLSASVSMVQPVMADALLDFTSSLSSFKADFTQTVYDSDSEPLQESSGHVELQRPGKFRWTYNEPSKQVIVADGVTLWVYDEEIQQVTMQPQATTLGSAPIGLLTGQRPLDSEFSITPLGIKDGLDWFQLSPKVQDSDFNEVYLALDDSGLKAMELRDNFSQATQIRFQNFTSNTSLDESQFIFTVPEDADVIGEAGVAGQAAAPAADPSNPAAGAEPLLTPAPSGMQQQTDVTQEGEKMLDSPAADPATPAATSAQPPLPTPPASTTEVLESATQPEPIVSAPDGEITWEETKQPAE